MSRELPPVLDETPESARDGRDTHAGRRRLLRVNPRDLVYSIYERRLARKLAGKPMPRHVAAILDGNRRWARAAGADDVSHGHQAGADHILDLLRWCDEAHVEVVTLWLLSTDNLSRPPAELNPLLRII